MGDALGQVGVGDIGATEGGGVDKVLANQLLGLGGIVSTGSKDGAVKGLADALAEMWAVGKAACLIRLGQVQKGRGALVDLRHQPQAVFFFVAEIHAVKGAQGRQADADMLAIPSADAGVEHV